MAEKRSRIGRGRKARSNEAPEAEAGGGATDQSSVVEPETVESDGPGSLGAFIRAQRQLSNLSLRQLSTMSEISNAYLSQIERDLHEPSLRVLKRVSDALGLPPELLLSRAGMVRGADQTAEQGPDPGGAGPTQTTEQAIQADPLLSEDEKQALLTVYRSYLANKN